ncbi:hypothetical protein CRUP_021563 [Coryphaenoides rupestris]|nr:hypothetical protein CRUP_021563 [Coryphaenoides rupestris]
MEETPKKTQSALIQQRPGEETSKVHVSETSTSTVPNTSPTAASASSDLNGAANACEILRKRLEPYRTQNPKGSWEDWVEGGFLQGVGLFTLEQLRYSPQGVLYSRGPGTYKIPSFGDIPSQLIVEKNADPEMTLLTYLRRKSVTTVEGIGSVARKLHPVQERIARAHGSQCGFCTPGIVMSMYALLRNNPTPDMTHIEDAFQGNLCRCTGYRPILEGYKTFTKSAPLFQPSEFTPFDPTQEVIYPPELMALNRAGSPGSLRFRGERVEWLQPSSLEQLLGLKSLHPQAKLVVGNTEVGIEVKFKNMLYPVILAPAFIPELQAIEYTEKGIVFGAACTLTCVREELKRAVSTSPAHQSQVFEAVLEQLRWFAGLQIRNAIGGNIMTASPISDLNPVLQAAGCTLTLASTDGRREVQMDETFFQGYRKTLVRPQEILLSVTIPYSTKWQFVSAFKQSPRREDDISIVTTAMSVSFTPNTSIVNELKLSYGGMAPTTVLAKDTASKLHWGEGVLGGACSSLLSEMTVDPSAPGGMVTYRRTLTLSLFYKFYLTVQQKLAQEHMEDVVGRPIMHLSALKQATGEAVYCDDIPLYENELYVALVTCVGHIIGAVVADSQVHAQRAAKAVKVTYQDITPLIITIQSNVTLAVPRGEDGEMELFVSTQSTAKTQSLVAMALGVPANRVVVRVKRMGGGFGGKESRSTILSTVVAVCAQKLQRPVRCMLDRDEDMVVTGGRHPFYAKYKVGFQASGKVLALDTHLPSNTAFRGFGGPQGMMVTECWMSDVLANLTLDRCWAECLRRSDYHQRLAALQEYNRQNRWTKRGLAIIPTKFGISFTALFLNQAGALVHIYTDGSVLLTHGGTEMGQGLHTKMVQVASRVLGVSSSKVHISETSTSTVPNTSPTAASASSDLNGAAVQAGPCDLITNACEILRKRLEPYRTQNPKGSWEDWVKAAYYNRVSLSTNGFYKTPDLGYDFETNSGRPFNYFSYGVACSEVEVDCLTGSHKNLHTTIVMDVGHSLNPAIDIGQVEGGFLQGVGLFTLEQLRYSPQGVLYSRGPGTYKIPSFGDIPSQLVVSLLRDAPNDKAIYSSKAVGEPPLFLAASVFFALKDAVVWSRAQAGLSGPCRLDSPATPERIRLACQDRFTALCPPAEPGTFEPWDVQV